MVHSVVGFVCLIVLVRVGDIIMSRSAVGVGSAVGGGSGRASLPSTWPWPSLRSTDPLVRCWGEPLLGLTPPPPPPPPAQRPSLFPCLPLGALRSLGFCFLAVVGATVALCCCHVRVHLALK